MSDYMKHSPRQYSKRTTISDDLQWHSSLSTYRFSKDSARSVIRSITVRGQRPTQSPTSRPTRKPYVRSRHQGGRRCRPLDREWVKFCWIFWIEFGLLRLNWHADDRTISCPGMYLEVDAPATTIDSLAWSSSWEIGMRMAISVGPNQYSICCIGLWMWNAL
jgi:hypothetical protein